MKINFSKICLLLSMMAIAFSAYSENSVNINGIWYDIKINSDEAVLSSAPQSISGDIVIPSSVDFNGKEYPVTSIKANVFYNCKNLTGIELPNTIKSIGEKAFRGCVALNYIELSNSITSIKEQTFMLCSNLKKIKIPSSVTSISDNAFFSCTSLVSVEIPNSLKTIGEGAFNECKSLTKLYIPDSVIEIGEKAFYNCSKLTYIEIGEGLQKVGKEAFLYSPIATAKINCKSVPNYLFKGIGALVNLELGSSVTKIGNSSFAGCKGLKEVFIPNSVTIIDWFAFSECKSLTKVSLGNAIESLGFSAFENCSSLEEMFCYAYNPPECDHTFSGLPKDPKPALIVPEVSIDKYKAIYQFNTYFYIIGFDPEEAGINEIQGEYKYEIYTLNGFKILTTCNIEDLNNLPKKIYIVNGRKMIIGK